MKNERSVFLLLFALLAGIISCSSVFAAIGVSPSIYEVNFEPGLEKTFIFNFFIDNEDMYLQIEKSGDFADYLKFDKTKIDSHGRVIATLKLPNVPEKYGVNYLYVAGKQEGEAGAGFGITGVIRAVIKIRVPYPGKYAEGTLFVNNTKKGELTNYELNIFNRGSENLQVGGIISLISPSGDEMGRINLEKQDLPVASTKKISGFLDTTRYPPGKYDAKAILEFGGSEKSEVRTQFKVGELSVSITNYTREVKRDKINRFEVQIESNWNDPITGLYGEGELIGRNMRFKTPSANLDSFATTQLTGYFDTTNITEDKIKIKMDLVYAGIRTSKMLDVYFEKEKKDMRMTYIALASIATIIFLILIIVFITFWAFRKKSGGNHGNKKGRKK